MDSETTDQELVAAGAKGDVRAFGRLVERHHGAVAAVAFAITRDLALSEDIAQDTFVVAWTHLRELRDLRRVRAWLCGIARNLSKTELRDRRREVTDIEAIQTMTADAHALIEAAEAQRALRVSLDELPATYREPLVLFYWQDQSIEHVASALEITAQAAQKRISRARTMIGAELAARLDTTARTRRPAKAAAAAIVAVLATGGARVSEAARHSIRRALPKTLGALGAVGAFVAMATLAIVVWIIATPRSSASPVHNERAEAVERVSAGEAPQLPTPPTSAETRDVPASYTIYPLPPYGVTIDLNGDPPPPMVPALVPPPNPRHVRGRVVDAAGKPVRGAVVAVGISLRSETGTLFADSAATSNANGDYDVAVAQQDLLQVMAFHPRAGWSAPRAIPRGADDAKKDLQVVPTGGLSGVVRREGVGAEAKVVIEVREMNADFVVQTDASGRFAVPQLPPGNYRVRAASAEQAHGTGRNTVEDVIVGAAPASVVLDLPTGAVIAVNVEHTSGLQFYSVELLADGRQIIPNLGMSPDQGPAQFHDIAPGSYTICVLKFSDAPVARACKSLELRATDSVVELAFD